MPARADHLIPADGVGPWGDGLILRLLTAPGGAGADPTVYAASALDAAIRGPVLEALRALPAGLALAGALLFVGAVFQVRLRLRPLGRLRDQFAEVRAGGRDRLPGRQPEEVRPRSGRSTPCSTATRPTWSTRGHVANLARGLKTPLATLSLAIADPASVWDESLVALVACMDRQIRHHLRRARTTSIGGPSRGQVDLGSRAADPGMVPLRIHAAKGVDLALGIPDGLAVACDRQDLDEMLGNLIENACQWCRCRVRVEAVREGKLVSVRVDDDGPRLDEPLQEAVLKRGSRLDESQLGHGFGLPIAHKLAEL